MVEGDEGEVVHLLLPMGVWVSTPMEWVEELES